MIEMKRGLVIKIIQEAEEITEVLLEIDHEIRNAINYNRLCGPIKLGDEVILNTTAGSLKLGTGGYHFVISNASIKNKESAPGGHGMKLRYTPMQIKVSYQEEDGQQQHIYNTALHLKGIKLFFGELHSMVPPLCSYLKYYSREKIRIAYIMTDHAALPIAFSKNITSLKKMGLIDTTITTGNAFGGDYECVNIYTALQTAVHAAQCNAVIITMGPGITGTATEYGFSGLELGFYADLCSRLEGKCFYIPRIGFGDDRIRHQGLSHHSLISLIQIMQQPIELALPLMPKEKLHYVVQQMKRLGNNPHRIYIMDGSGIEASMAQYNLMTTTMGRGIKKEPYFFHAIGAAGKKSMEL